MNPQGKTLLVRKRGTSAFMQPGGKLMDGESPLVALEREIGEELGCTILPGSSRSLGTFVAPAANEVGWMVEAQLYAVTLDGDAQAQAEIDEAIWIDPAALDGLDLAPLSRDHVMPLALRMGPLA